MRARVRLADEVRAIAAPGSDPWRKRIPPISTSHDPIQRLDEAGIRSLLGPDHSPEQTLAAIAASGTRSLVLADLARHHHGRGRLEVSDELFAQALGSITAIRIRSERTSATCHIASQLHRCAPADPATVRRAIDLITGTSRWGPARRTLADLVRRVHATDPTNPDVVAWATDLAAGIEPGVHKNAALAAIATQMQSADPGATDRALTMVDGLGRGPIQAAALCDIARRLHRTDPTRAAALFDRAVDHAAQLEPAGSRNDLMATIGRHLHAVDPADPAVVDNAVAHAEQAHTADQRASQLARLARALHRTDADRAGELFDRAITIVTSSNGLDEDTATRPDALATVACELHATDPGDGAVLERVVELSHHIDDNVVRYDTVARIVQGLPPGDTTAIDRLCRSAAGSPDIVMAVLAGALGAPPSDGPADAPTANTPLADAPLADALLTVVDGTLDAPPPPTNA